MKIKHIIIWFDQYVLNLPAYLFHEFCHWIYLIPWWCLGLVTRFPRLIVDRWANWTPNPDTSGYNTNSHYMRINYDMIDTKFNDYVIVRICAFMPVIGFITLFIISNWYLRIYYISQLSTFWLSSGDYNRILYGDNENK